MLIILEKGRRSHQMQQIGQCYNILAELLTPELLSAWGLAEDNPAVVSHRMIDWAMEGDGTVQTVWRQHADNIGDEPGGSIASCQSASTSPS